MSNFSSLQHSYKTIKVPRPAHNSTYWITSPLVCLPAFKHQQITQKLLTQKLMCTLVRLALPLEQVHAHACKHERRRRTCARKGFRSSATLAKCGRRPSLNFRASSNVLCKIGQWGTCVLCCKLPLQTTRQQSLNML